MSGKRAHTRVPCSPYLIRTDLPRPRMHNLCYDSHNHFELCHTFGMVLLHPSNKSLFLTIFLSSPVS